MPTLELSESELKAMWLILDLRDSDREMGAPVPVDAFRDAELTLFEKVYRAYRGMPERPAA